MRTRILVIEDNEANLELMRFLLSAHSYEVLCATSGEEGLVLTREQRPDLIICDIQMPGLDGYEVAAQLKQDPELASIPLLGVTALAMMGDREKVLAGGFDGYIAKPIEPELFLDQLEPYLPAGARGKPVMISDTEEPNRVAPAPVATLLAVDDRPINLLLHRSTFEPLGYNVLTAETMAEGYELARRWRPDLIICDVELASPKGGFEFIQTIKADPNLKSIPFIFLTSTHCCEVTKAQGLELGATRFLFRPIDPESLLLEVQACLNSRRGTG